MLKLLGFIAQQRECKYFSIFSAGKHYMVVVITFSSQRRGSGVAELRGASEDEVTLESWARKAERHQAWCGAAFSKTSSVRVGLLPVPKDFTLECFQL